MPNYISLAKTFESFDSKFFELYNTRLRDSAGRAMDDPWGVSYWVYCIQAAIYDQELDLPNYASIGLTFELADMFAATTSINGEMQ